MCDRRLALPPHVTTTWRHAHPRASDDNDRQRALPLPLSHPDDNDRRRTFVSTLALLHVLMTTTTRAASPLSHLVRRRALPPPNNDDVATRPPFPLIPTSRRRGPSLPLSPTHLFAPTTRQQRRAFAVSLPLPPLLPPFVLALRECRSDGTTSTMTCVVLLLL